MARKKPASDTREFPAVTHTKKRAYLQAFTVTGNSKLASEAARISRKTAYNWTKADPAFVEALAEATDMAADGLEAEARRRATEGLVRYKFQKNGKPVLHPDTGKPYYELEYSDTLLIFLLKGARPEKYRERYEHSGPEGGPIEFTEARAYVAAKLEKFTTRSKA